VVAVVAVGVVVVEGGVVVVALVVVVAVGSLYSSAQSLFTVQAFAHSPAATPEQQRQGQRPFSKRHLTSLLLWRKILLAKRKT